MALALGRSFGIGLVFVSMAFAPRAVLAAEEESLVSFGVGLHGTVHLSDTADTGDGVGGGAQIRLKLFKILSLRMDLRVAVDLARRSLKDLGVQAFREPEHIDRAMNAGLGRLDRRALVVGRRGRAGEIVDLVHLDDEWHGHIVPQQLEHRILHQMRNIMFGARVEIVDAENFMARIE